MATFITLLPTVIVMSTGNK